LSYFRKKGILIPLEIDKQRAPKKGDLLLSEPFLFDENFSRSVIYLCEHNEEGSFGFILNDTLKLDLHQIARGFPELNATVGYGGPVDKDQLFFLHSYPEVPDSTEIAEGIYIGGDYNKLLEMLSEGTLSVGQIRFFIGYTGWGPGQLEQETEDKTWIVTDVPKGFSLIGSSNDSLWKEMLSKLGGKYRFMSEYPVNPSNN
jgi:putative transcriptional regulator